MFKGKPVSNLLAAEGNLTSTVANVEERMWMFGVNLPHNTKCTTARGRDRATSFVTKKQLRWADR